MSIASVRFFSDALGKWTRYNVILPEEGEGPFPVLLQLAGLGGDCDSWLEHTNIMRHVAGLPLVVVLPEGGTSAYLNWKSSDRLHQHRYEDLMMIDIPRHLRRHFNVKNGRWAIGGLSMGGYGAVRLGLKHPDRFSSIHAHSATFRIEEAVDPVDATLVEDAGDSDVYCHAEAIAMRNERPVVAFDCGLDDRFVEHNRKFHQHLDTLGVDHHYAEFEGGHDWDYWDLHVREALAQHAKVLGLS